MDLELLGVDRGLRSARDIVDPPVIDAAPAAVSAAVPLTRAERLSSLDAFRGITIVAMILVNNPGAWDEVYAPLEHAAWNGWTPTDLIFPFFLFIIGVAITFSLDQRRGRGAGKREILASVAGRTLLIFGLGIFLNGFPLFDWSALRIPGVLQRIALCYGVTSMVVLTSSVRRQSLTALLLVGGSWLLAALTPDGWLRPEATLGARLDDTLLRGHLLHEGWDPEGLVSTLPAIATTLAGALTGHWLRSRRPMSARVAGLAFAGVGATGLGLLMDRWCPINKSLWSASYVVFTAGVALIGLAVCVWLIDVRSYRRWATPFIVYGMNPLVAYVLSTLVAKEMFLWRVTRADGRTLDLHRYLFESIFLPLARPIDASLLYSAAYVLVWLGVASLLYRQRVLIKI
jgi:predicted acyltransferase